MADVFTPAKRSEKGPAGRCEASAGVLEEPRELARSH